MDLKILIRKLEHCGINGKNLSWFKNYLTNRKQIMQYDSNNNNNNNNNNNIKNNNNKNNNSKNINSNFEKTVRYYMWCTTEANFRTTPFYTLNK